MRRALLKSMIRARFSLMSRSSANRQVRKLGHTYLEIGQALVPEAGKIPVRVPRMPGVDEEMRAWSYFQLLEHNTIVNRQITLVTTALARGHQPTGGIRDPKKDVLPGGESGPEQLEALRESLEQHQRIVGKLGSLRRTPTYPHPLFGPFTAHKWHCMFGFHLLVHLKQARLILRGSLKE